MSSVCLQVVSDKDKFNQKCVVPSWLLGNTKLQVGDFIAVKGSKKTYICRIYVTVSPLAFIFVSDIVTCGNFLPPIHAINQEVTTFSDNIEPIKVFNFECISVKIICEDGKNLLNLNKTSYENIIHRILTGYVFTKDCIINCRGIKLADFFQIHSIVISETVPIAFSYGRILKSSNVKISDLQSWKQFHLIRELQRIKLGGINGALRLLKSHQSHNKFHNIIISGPPGCGKSSFVKSFCCSNIHFYVILDGLKNPYLNSVKCNKYYNHFSSYVNMFPSKKRVLFIDHIDAIAPYYSSKKAASSISALVNLINKLGELQVPILASTVHRKALDSKISSLFKEEVNLGIPSFQQRKEMIRTQAELLNCNIDSHKITEGTPGFVGHDISELFKRTVNDKELQTDTTCLTTEDIEKCLVDCSPSILKTSRWHMKVQPVYWEDIGGMFTVKKRLQMCIEKPLQNPEIFQKIDLLCPHGVLLFGPPGCCKTTLARGLATECNANFFAANPAQIYSAYVGESEKNILELFYQARLCSPSIIFFDELDSLVSKRKLDSKSQNIGEKVLSALLNEMDGFGVKLPSQGMQSHFIKDENDDKERSNDVIVVAATNRPDLIDDALLRPGRFDVILYVPPPNLEERISIIETLIKGMPIKEVDVKKIAENTEFYSGADLKYLCNGAAKNALRHDMSAMYITEENFNEATMKTKPSITKQQLEMYKKLSGKYGVIKSF